MSQPMLLPFKVFLSHDCECQDSATLIYFEIYYVMACLKNL